MAVTFQFKRGKSSTFTKKNLILKAGEPGFELDTLKLKIGDGQTAWNDLAYVNEDEIILGDNNSIIVEDHVISLVGLAEAPEGYSIRKDAKGRLEWYQPVEQSQISSLMELVNQKADSNNVYNKEEVDNKFYQLFEGAPEHLDSLKEITDWITTDTMAMIEMQNKVNSIENGAQENKIEQIKIGDSLIEITDKVANIPAATIDAYGVVKSSTAINQINVDETGFMEVNSISVEKLRNDDCQLILRSGKAQI